MGIVKYFDGIKYEYISDNLSYYQHQANAESKGGDLVWISSEAENNFVKDFASPYTSVIWIGGRRKGGGNNFGWTSPYSWNFAKWWRGEPNNWGGREDAVMMYLHKGATHKGHWNDGNGAAGRPAVYKYPKVIQGPPGRDGRDGDDGVVGPQGPQGIAGDLTPEYIELGQQTQVNADESSDNATFAEQSADDAAQSASLAEDHLNDIQDLFNTGALESAASNYGEYTEMTDVLRNGFSNKENFVENMTGDTDVIDSLTAQEYIQQKIIQANENINKEIIDANYTRKSEILAQKNDIVNKVLMDFMIDSQNGSNIEKVYEQLKQENNDINRNNQIKTYYNKAYNEYIFILKVVICLIVLLLPIIFLNKYEIINQNISLILIFSIIIIGFLFIGYRLYLLYMKDDIDFNKIRIPYDRQANELIKQGKMKSKESIFKNLGVVCVGDECCDTSMVYDNLNNKCILSENFGGYFESLQNKEGLNVIEPYGNYATTETFVTNTVENLTSTKEGLLRESLLNSGNGRFNI
jgi:hypothetical protein